MLGEGQNYEKGEVLVPQWARMGTIALCPAVEII